MVGGIGELGFKANERVALLQGLTDEVIRQLDLELGMPSIVRFAFPGRELLELEIERARRHLDLGIGDRLAEEVVAL